MAESWRLIDGHRSSDGLTYTAVYWCSNTGAIKTETTSDGRFRAGDGPRIKRPTQAVELDQLRQRVAEVEAKLALAEQDARRLDWLNDSALFFVISTKVTGTSDPVPIKPTREAIDAAMDDIYA